MNLLREKCRNPNRIKTTGMTATDNKDKQQIKDNKGNGKLKKSPQNKVIHRPGINAFRFSPASVAGRADDRSSQERWTVPADGGRWASPGALSVAVGNIIEYLMKSHNNIDINTYGIAAPNMALELHGSRLHDSVRSLPPGLSAPR